MATRQRAVYGSGRSASLRSGYIRIRRPGRPLAAKDGYVYEHRLVWYEAGREIPPEFHIHHIDHDKTNNALDNLPAEATTA